MGKLDGLVAIVTGAGAGIGRAGAELFAEEGARVVVVDVDGAAADATVASIAAAGGEALAARTDLTKPEQVEAMAAAAVEAYGRIDILWNNAGIVRGLYTPIDEFPLDVWHQVLDVDLNGVFYGIRAVVPRMKAQRSGVILSTASIAGVVANHPGRAPYTAAKGAIIALTRELALELAGHNIRVNCVAPGRVRTDIALGEQRPAESPFGVDWDHPDPQPVTDATRIAEPIEIARTALYLVSPDVGPLTGITVVHDGGRTTR